MAYDTITFTVDEGVGILTLNRPQALNAFTVPMLEEMALVLDGIEDGSSGVRCLLLTGAGRGFSSGADLASDFIGGGAAKVDAGRILETHFNPIFERLMKLPVPFVTAVNGPAAGAGCSFAIAGDLVFAARSAYFLQAFINIGLIPDVGSTWLLPRLIGKARAQAMMMLGEKVPAETALAWGMIYKVVEDDTLMSEAMAAAHRLAKGPTLAHKLIRTMTRDALENDLTSQLRLERENQLTAGRTKDFTEGVAAFLSKRPANFTGN
jgi:2-(1,2-epoxy-1,2-dihydrophenyl)acetyl-CoA isomerase